MSRVLGVVFLAVCCTAFAPALTQAGPTSEEIITTNVLSANDANGCPVLVIKNVSSRDISAYGVSIDRLFLNGQGKSYGSSEDFITQAISFADHQYADNGWFHPLEERTLPIDCAGLDNRLKPESVRVKVDLIMFSDGTSLGSNETLFLHILATRKRLAAADRRARVVVQEKLSAIAGGRAVTLEEVAAEIRGIANNIATVAAASDPNTPMPATLLEIADDIANESRNGTGTPKDYLTRLQSNLQKHDDIYIHHTNVGDLR